MNTRAKTFDATGIAPGGRLFAGDLNLIQDVVAAMVDYTQNIGLQTVMIGDSSLILAKFGTGEVSLAANFRTSGIARGLGGVFAGNYTTTARDAIPLGSRPTSLIVYNTTNARFEYNSGTDTTPSWAPIAATTTTGTVSQGTLASRPTPAASGANTWYFATDVNGGTLYYSNASAWTTVGVGLTAAPQAHAATHHPTTGTDKITMSLAGTAASRPAFGAVAIGTLYFATDTGVTSRSDGSTAWTTIASSSGVSAHASTHLAGGSDAITWGSVHLFGTLAARPAAAASNLGYLYFATDNLAIYECVAGPSWSTIFQASLNSQGTLASRPAAASVNTGFLYLANDVNGGTTYVSTGAAWTQAGAGVTSGVTAGATITFAQGSLTVGQGLTSGAGLTDVTGASVSVPVTGTYLVETGAAQVGTGQQGQPVTIQALDNAATLGPAVSAGGFGSVPIHIQFQASLTAGHTVKLQANANTPTAGSILGGYMKLTRLT